MSAQLMGRPPLAGLSVTSFLTHFRKGTTRLPLATGHVIYPSRALYPFGGEGGT